MIINTKTGILVTGTLARDAEYKTVGQKNTPLLKFGVLYGHEETPGPDGRTQGKFLDVNVWGAAAVSMQGRLHKGDAVAVAGELKSREDDQGRLWRSLDSRGEVWPGAAWILEHIASAQVTAGAMQGNVLDPTKLGSGDFEAIDDNEDLPF